MEVEDEIKRTGEKRRLMNLLEEKNNGKKNNKSNNKNNTKDSNSKRLILINDDQMSTSPKSIKANKINKHN